MQNKRIYMDVCCLNRPFDNQSQDRVFLESESILAVMSHCERGSWTLTSSDMIEYELSRLSNASKLRKIKKLCNAAKDRIVSTENTKALARDYQKIGVKIMDSYHLALCEENNISVLLTTDDRFIRAAAKIMSRTRVVNPVLWLMEVTTNEE